jgi:hypothetical protein
VAKWQAQILPRQQSLHYIAVTAQEHLEEHVPHRSNKSIQYLSGQNHRCFGVLDIQVAHSTVKTEVTELVNTFPQVHLGIDPEFSLKTDTFQVLKVFYRW